MTSAMEAIIDGCKTIADEVGTMKIGKPYSGEDPNYIESPYSHKSIQDFYDNIISIQSVYMGGIEGNRDARETVTRPIPFTASWLSTTRLWMMR